MLQRLALKLAEAAAARAEAAGAADHSGEAAAAFGHHARVGGRARPGAWIGLAICSALLATALVALFLSMRDVLDVGGSCASGGPYEIATPCPSSTWLTAVAIPALFLFGAGLALAAWRIAGPTAAALPLACWPAMFLSLGWNFLDYGAITPPDGVVDIGFLAPGVVFVLMGAPTLWPLGKLLGRLARQRPALLIVAADAAIAGGVGGWLLVQAMG